MRSRKHPGQRGFRGGQSRNQEVPKKLRDELVAAHQARPHHVLPDSGWVSLPLNRDEDLKWAVVLLRYSYELARQQLARREGVAVPAPKTASTAAATLAEVA